VLRVGLPPGCEVIDYADDIVVVVEGDSFPDAIKRADICGGRDSTA